MIDVRVARRYAQALFEAATHLNVIQSVEDDLAAVVRVMESDAQVRDFLLAPYTSREEKIAILDRSLGDRVTALTMQVLRIMLEKRRETELPGVYQEFVSLRRQAQGIVHVVVTSAYELDAAERQALESRLREKVGATVEADYRVDARVIGGVRVAFGNTVLDGSVRGALNRLRERIHHDLLKQA